jgi:ATP-dependent protease ClpP protease subunit
MKLKRLALSALFLIGLIAGPAYVHAEEEVTTLNIVLPDKCEKDWQDELSGMTYVIGDTAYTSIFSSLSVSDSKTLWKDFTVIEHASDIRILEMFLNSPGGSAFDGLAMADQIQRAKSHGFHVRIYASGIVASAAVPIFASASERIAAPGTVFMVHEASLWKWPGRETHSDIIAQGKLLDMIRTRYLSILADNTKLSKETWKTMEGSTTWFDAEKAKKWGLVDKID